MSTKIYNAFKIDTNDIFEVQNILMNHHEEVKTITQEKTIEFLIKTAVLNLDKDIIYKEDTSKNYLSKAGSELQERQRKVRKEQERDSEIDFGAEILVIPYEGKFYGMYYAEPQEFLQSLLNHPKISDFSYWNNSDRPEEVSAKEWKQRQKIWDEIFKDGSVPCEVGFSKKFNSFIPYPEIEDIVKNWDKFCPTYEQRVNHWSEDVYFSREMNSRKKEVESDIASGDLSEIMSLFWEVKRDKSPEAQAKKDAIKAEMEEILMKEVTINNIGIPLDRVKKLKMR